jgi:hypothetical protein
MDAAESKSNVGLTYGLIAGLIITMITLLQYLGGVTLFNSPLNYLTYLALTIFAVLAVLKIRKRNEGFIEFGEALKITFTVFALGLLIQSVFAYILFNFIDTDFREVIRSQDEINTEKLLRKMNYPDTKIDETIENAKKIDQFSILGVSLGYSLTCIVSFIFCLLISLIVKKSKPAFNNI